jgi:hypothetical protein
VSYKIAEAGDPCEFISKGCRARLHHQIPIHLFR